jgi:hypothetical protein
MQKKKNTKSRAVDLLIILLCFAGTAVSGFAFWREYNRTLVKLNEEPVGSIVFKNRTAHRKIENRAAWDRLKQESPVYNGDTIRTAEASEAFITFQDSVTRVNLYENTLIQVFYDGQETRIDFSGGNLDVTSGGRSVFISGSISTLEVGSGSQASLNKGGDGLSLSVLEGQAKLDDGTEFESGTVLSFLNDGTLDTNPAIAVTSFGPFARVLAGADGTAVAAFAWNAVNFDQDTHVILEVSRDRGFSRIVQTRDVSGASSVTLALETGEYWWRAYPVQGDSRAVPARGSASGRIETLPAAALSIIAPSPAREFTFSGDIRVPFSWTTVEGVDEYLFEISGSADMGNPVVSRQVPGTSVTQTGLEPGRWYWRVTPVFSPQVKGTALPSETGVFSIARNDAPAVPVLIAPAQNGLVGADHLRLSWKHDSGVASWIVELADNSQMSRPLLRQESVSNFYSPPAGTLENEREYFWRVVAQGARGTTSSSPVRSFTAGESVYRGTAIFPPDNYSVTDEEFRGIQFSYQSNAPTPNYFQVSSQSDFSSLALNDPVEGGSFYPASALEPGIWYWRIYTEGGAAGTASRRLNVVSASRAPRVRSPSSLSRGDPLELAWDPLYFASYQVNLYGADDSQSPVERQVTETNSAALSTSSLEPGDYIVSVTGFNPESPRSGRITGVPSETRFTVTPAEPVVVPVIAALPAPVRPEPVLPPVRPEPAAAVVPEPEPVPLPVEPEPIAAVVPEPEPPPVEPEPVAAVVPEPEPVPLPVEPEPVVAVVPEPEPVLSFDLTAPPILGSLPPDGYVLTTGQLDSVSSVNFVWTGNSSEYRFTLYRANGELVVPPVTVNSPSFSMQNPRALAPGDYVWEVFERRFGESSVARFSVKEGPAVLAPLLTKDPGVLYGNR